MSSNQLDWQNFFSTTLAQTITASDTVIYLNSLPTPSEGFLVIEPDSTTGREVIYYTSKGVNYVTCPSVATGRGVGGTTAASHSNGATVQMNVVAEDLRGLQTGESNTGMHTYFDESFQNYVLSGASITQATGLIASISSGVAYINGRRLTFGAMSKTFTASKDTYVDIIETDGSNIATVSYTELASGATGSAPVSNGMHIAMVQTHTASITRTVQDGYDILGNPLKQVTPQSISSTGTWTAFTPMISATGGGAPTIGNGSISGRYQVIGKTCHVTFSIVVGSTTSFGTGALLVSYPLPPHTSVYTAYHRGLGTFYIEDYAVQAYIGWVRSYAGNSVYHNLVVANISGNGRASDVSGSTPVPMAWGTGDYIMGTYTYEIL